MTKETEVFEIPVELTELLENAISDNQSLMLLLEMIKRDFELGSSFIGLPSETLH